MLSKFVLNEKEFSTYVDLNEYVHPLFWRFLSSAVLQRGLDRIGGLHFASPSGFIGVQANTPKVSDMIIVAQSQHRQVLEAAKQREGVMAESVIREHARLAKRNLHEAMRHAPNLAGIHLIFIKGDITCKNVTS